jgi:YVTN family beta-propeller protein
MRSGRIATVVFAIVVLAGCAGSVAPAGAVQDLLYLQSSRGVTIVPVGASVPRFSGSTAVPAPNWSTMVRAQINGLNTDVIATDPATASTLWSHTVAGNLRVKVVSADGDLAVLSPTLERYFRDGRGRTTLVIVGGGSATAQSIVLHGNYEPEAFSTDGDSLFVIKYLPPRAPTRYQVRRLDLKTEKVVGVYTPDADLQKAMGGTARVQVASPDGNRLYTLYTVAGQNGEPERAFIHVLALDEIWAHCIDLPTGFTTAAESATALTVSPDGTRLYVANTATASLAVVDTKALQVLDTEPLGMSGRAASFAAHDSDRTIYVGSGDRLLAIDTMTLERKNSWVLPENIRGIQVGTEDKKIYVGLKRQVAVIDGGSGRELKTFDPPGVGRIDRFGLLLHREVRTYFNCAC